MSGERINKLREKMREERLDAFLITSYENYRYFSGFTGSNCALIITFDECFALSDGRYDIQLRGQARGFQCKIVSHSMNEEICSLISSYTRVGFETHKLTDFEVRSLRSLAGEVELVPCADFGEEIRAIKDNNEISAIKRAVKCSDDAFSSFIKKLSYGITECEASALLEYEMALCGSKAPAFDTIVATGLRTAMPHAEPQNTTIPNNCLMTLDFGATVDGYVSDITRTVHIGEPSKELCALWDLVFEVQQACISRIVPGMSARELDEYARLLFKKHGMEKYFSHSLGHGVGLAIHEAPTVSRRSQAILKENMVITIEPGLYVENLGGVRIEDTVLITKDGGLALTQSPHKVKVAL